MKTVAVVRARSLKFRAPAPLVGGLVVRNLVGRLAGALRGRKGLEFDIHQIL